MFFPLPVDLVAQKRPDLLAGVLAAVEGLHGERIDQALQMQP
jgi:hypothetical protein